MKEDEQHTRWCDSFDAFLIQAFEPLPEEDERMERLMDVGNLLRPSYRDTSPESWKRDRESWFAGLDEQETRIKDAKKVLKKAKCPSEYKAILKASDKFVDMRIKIIDTFKDQIVNGLKGLHDENRSALQLSQLRQNEVFEAGAIAREILLELDRLVTSYEQTSPILAAVWRRRFSDAASAA